MAFDRLQGLGEEKWMSITNGLINGKPAMALARQIQQEWKDFIDVGEKTLTQQLNRLRTQLQQGLLGEEYKKEVSEAGTQNIRRMRGKSLPVLEHMVAVANMQEDRIQKLWEKERDLGGMVMPGLDKVVDSYISILREIQKMQFDLGVDEYKGTLTLSRSVMETSRSPEGHIVQRNVVEAMEFAQKTFKLRGVYPPVLEAAK